MNKLSAVLLGLIAISALTIAVILMLGSCPLKTGVLNGTIVFHGNQQSQADVGSKIEFYESFVVVSVFSPDAKNQAKEVYPLGQIKMIRLK
jgi:hypothetical protein